MSWICFNEMKLFVSFIYSYIYLQIFYDYYSYADALDLVATGKVDVKPLVTHNFNIEQTVDAFEAAKSVSSGAIKVMIHCQ